MPIGCDSGRGAARIASVLTSVRTRVDPTGVRPLLVSVPGWTAERYGRFLADAWRRVLLVPIT